MLSKAAKELGVEVRTGMGVEEIIREKPFEGDVLGVVAKNAKEKSSVFVLPAVLFSLPAVSAPTNTCANSMIRALQVLVPTICPERRAKLQWQPSGWAVIS